VGSPRGAPAKPLLHVWAENCNVTRRVLGITDQSAERLALAVADYWTRIRRHQAQGDLARFGYFSGMQLRASPPIICLLAPALRFHPTTAAIISHLSPELEIVRVALTENRRRGLRVTRRR